MACQTNATNVIKYYFTDFSEQLELYQIASLHCALRNKW